MRHEAALYSAVRNCPIQCGMKLPCTVRYENALHSAARNCPVQCSTKTASGYPDIREGKIRLYCYGGTYSNQDLIWCVKIWVYVGVLGPSWVLITYNICPPVFAENRVSAIYQILLGWKTCEYYYETDRPTPQPKANPTQEKKKRLKVAIWAIFFPRSKYFSVGWDWFYVGNRLQETQPNQIFRKHPILLIVQF